MSNFYNYFEKNIWLVVFTSLFGACSSILIIAFAIDKILGYDPCILCLYERIPYAVIAIISGAAYFADEKYKKISLYLIFITALAGFGLATFHTGVEREWWSPTSHCTPHVHLDDTTTMADFLSQLDKAPIGDCAKPALKILGLSLAEMNVILNFLLLVIMYKLIRFRCKSQTSKKTS
jgi:disulfide bond formation protein DsbB